MARYLIVALLGLLTSGLFAQVGPPRMERLLPEVQLGYWKGRAVQYRNIDGYAITEGDINLGPVSEISADAPPAPTAKGQNERQSLMIGGITTYWTGGVIPYVIDPGLANTARVTDAMTHWQTKTGNAISFVVRTTQPDYVRFQTGSGCNANVGRIGGVQTVNLTTGCDVASVIHEIGHTVGLWHEHQRPDRDRYLTINRANASSVSLADIAPQQLENDTITGPYDFGSNMHYYGVEGFNGRVVMESVPAGLKLGREGLSAHDVDGVARRYRFAMPTTVDTNPSGLQVTVDGAPCTAPCTFNWTPGTPHTLAAVAGQTSSNGDTRYTFGVWSDGGAQSHGITAPNPADGFSQRVFTVHYVPEFRLQVAAVREAAGGSLIFAADRGTVTPAVETFYRNRSEATVQATATAGNFFVKWASFSDMVSRNPATFVMTYPRGAYAIFATAAPTTITSNVTDARVTVDGFEYNTPISFDWAAGTPHSLSVTGDQFGEFYRLPGTLRQFVSWSQGGTATQTLTPASRGLTFMANFTLSYQLDASARGNGGSGGGTVNRSPLGSSGYHPAGAVVQLTGTASAGYQFGFWGGDASGVSNPVSITLDRPKAATGSFAFQTCAATAQASVTAPGGGGRVDVQVSGPNSCFYGSASDEDWIGLSTPTYQLGNGVVTLIVAENRSGATRTGRVLIGRTVVTVTQGVTCVVAAPSPTAAASVAAGQSGSFQVNAPAGCSWTLSTPVPWITAFPSSGTGTTTVNYTVYPNFGSVGRSATLNVDGQSFVVTQPTSGLDETRRFVTLAYFNMLGRYPTNPDIELQTGALNGGLSRVDLLHDRFFTQAEFGQNSRFIAGMYVGILNRDAEFAGWLFQRTALVTGVFIPDQLCANFLGSPEFQVTNGSLSNANFVRLMYRQILGREASQPEVDSQVTTLNNNTASRQTFTQQFLNSGEFRLRSGGRLGAFLLYSTLLGRSPTNSELQNAASRLDGGTSPKTIMTELVATGEFTELLR